MSDDRDRTGTFGDGDGNRAEVRNERFRGRPIGPTEGSTAEGGDPDPPDAKPGSDLTMSSAGAGAEAAPGAGEGASATTSGALATPLDAFEVGVSRLQREAVRMASGDAESEVPRLNVEGRSETERELVERCRAFFRQWQTGQRKTLNEAVAAEERRVSEQLGEAELAIDRLERTTDDLRRLEDRREARRRAAAERGRFRRLGTRWYAAALGFLALVELFANAPVFVALLPRDPATERQILRMAETAEGWVAGTQRVLAELVLRPDAALLAAGVVTFLLVLAHFFGHSLRAAVARREARPSPGSAPEEPLREDLVPLILAGLGLILVVGVLYQARVTLGDVGLSRWEQDVATAEELRGEAAALRVDGDLAAATERIDRAQELEAGAAALRDYATSMSRLSLPILLLNATLVLCAISAAYFHHQVSPRPPDEGALEAERRTLLADGDAAAVQVSGLLGGVADHLRRLRDLLYERSLTESHALVHELEAVVTLYRSENGRVRGLDPRRIPAFREPVALEIDPAGEGAGEPLLHRRSPDEYDRERLRLKDRFAEARKRFAEAAAEW